MPGTRAKSPLPARSVLRRALEEGSRGPAWHGASVLTALHLAYTRHVMLHRLDIGAVSRFPRRLRVAWWPMMPKPASADAWQADLDLLSDYQDRLLAALAKVPQSRLRRRRSGQPNPIGFEVLGLAMHDAYHTGQIRLLLRLRGRS